MNTQLAKQDINFSSVKSTPLAFDSHRKGLRDCIKNLSIICNILSAMIENKHLQSSPHNLMRDKLQVLNHINISVQEEVKRCDKIGQAQAYGAGHFNILQMLRLHSLNIPKNREEVRQCSISMSYFLLNSILNNLKALSQTHISEQTYGNIRELETILDSLIEVYA